MSRLNISRAFVDERVGASTKASKLSDSSIIESCGRDVEGVARVGSETIGDGDYEFVSRRPLLMVGVQMNGCRLAIVHDAVNRFLGAVPGGVRVEVGGYDGRKMVLFAIRTFESVYPLDEVVHPRVRVPHVLLYLVEDDPELREGPFLVEGVARHDPDAGKNWRKDYIGFEHLRLTDDAVPVGVDGSVGVVLPTADLLGFCCKALDFVLEGVAKDVVELPDVAGDASADVGAELGGRRERGMDGIVEARYDVGLDNGVRG